ncbi:hypothetical protein [Acetobacterium sp.]|uniref:hypothetical protein n=1 Tax=Acetobacterium sp. TaxID=1872094 RepID=UPI002F408149
MISLQPGMTVIAQPSGIMTGYNAEDMAPGNLIINGGTIDVAASNLNPYRAREELHIKIDVR